MYPRRTGVIPVGNRTPDSTLGLHVGEVVRVRSHGDILRTLDKNNRNRGLYFDAEMVPYCGKVLRVRSRVRQIVDEKSGKIIKMKSPCFILENAVCQARYSDCRMFCPSGIFSFWHEAWLERVV